MTNVFNGGLNKIRQFFLCWTIPQYLILMFLITIILPKRKIFFKIGKKKKIEPHESFQQINGYAICQHI